MKTYFLTDKGQVRDHNEDAGGVFWNGQNQLLVAVADGMGGHKAGDVASEMTTTALFNKWLSSETLQSPDEAENWLKDCIEAINNDIYAYAQAHEDCKGMGTTVVACVCAEEFITIAHIGDSRCYLFNDQGFHQITEDHSLVNELVRTGQISKDDAEHHPRKNVLLKALGTEIDISAEVQTIGWEKENILLLCSDGLSNKINDEELFQTIKDSDDLEITAKELVHIANERGGEDNISLLLVHYDTADVAEEGVS